MPVADDAFAARWAALPRKRVASGVLFQDDAGRHLLVKPTYKQGWEIPGGLVEDGESPRAAARREVAEELGLAIDLGPLLVCDWSPAGRRPDDALMFVFAADTPCDDRITLDPVELSTWRWCTPAEVPRLVHTGLARRIAAAGSAAAAGTFTELLDGHPVS